MAILWQSSHFPFHDPNGEPYSGAKAHFFDANTTTPRTVYRESSLGEVHDHPVIANASGMFPAVFLPAGDYRVRVEDADGVVLFDTDGISTPPTGESGGGGGGGDTEPTLLLQTGMYIFSHQTGPLSGWVRANGRTIGNPVSGATERANADCEALFLHLWSQDATLAVSGGRGASAAGDWAAGKRIDLPNLKLRGLIGMASMGGTAATLIDAAAFDGGENGDVLGATVGAGRVTLDLTQIPAHNHPESQAVTAGAHNHGYSDSTVTGTGPLGAGGAAGSKDIAQTTSTAGAHSHPLTITSQGGGQAHQNVQPSAVATAYIKL